MNISPADTDVRQGLALAETGGAKQTATIAQTASPQADPADAASSAAAAAADKTSAREAAQKLSAHFQGQDTGLKIRVLDDSKSSVQVEVVDEKSNKVLRKIPQDELIKLSASINAMTGVLLNKPG